MYSVFSKDRPGSGSNLKGFTIRAKLVYFTVVLVVVSVFATLGPALYMFAQYSDDIAQQQTAQGLVGLRGALDEYKKDALHFGTVVSTHPEVVAAIQSKDGEAVRRVLLPLLKNSDIDFATITDETGRVIVRTHDSQKGDMVTNQANVQSALNGKALAAIEPGTAVKLSVRAGTPVRNGQGQLVGVLSAGYYITRDEIVDEVKKQYGTDVTLFLGDTRVATTIIKDGQRVVGTKLSEAVAEKVLGKGEAFTGKTEILGLPYVTAYTPLLGSDNKPIGVLFAGKSIAEAVAAKNKMMVVAAVISCLVLLAVLVLISWLSKRLTKPMNDLAVAMKDVAQGDLTKTVAVQSRDEAGQLADGFNQMIEQLTALIRQVKTSADTMTTASQVLKVNGEQSAQAAGHVAETIAQVASDTLEQTGAATETLVAVETMADHVRQAAANAEQVAGISEKTVLAARVGNQAVEKAVGQMANIDKSVTQSAVVIGNLGQRSQEIGNIVEIIAGIAAQTNLLALNAAIEAARAGEHGRGFAVVAEEVRKLAEQSHTSTEQITELIHHIQTDTDSAIRAMNNGSQEVKNGIVVVNEAGQSFGEIAGLIEQVLAQSQNISRSTRELAANSQTVVASVRQIETSSQHIAGQTQTVSAATEEQMASVEEIASSGHTLAQLAAELEENVKRFIVD